MIKNNVIERVKSFGMTNYMLLEDLSEIARQYDIELGHLALAPETVERDFYPQLNAAIRAEAAEMAKYYEVFYSLEKTIRALVEETIVSDLQTQADWWDSPRVPQNIHADVRSRIQKEIDAGVTRRSTKELDYTTFGELSVLITANWDLFGSIFNSKKALEKVFASLNALRNPIAHCTSLAEDEQLRLRLAVRDWFRLMEK